MAMNMLDLLLPPLTGAFIGYFTNALAIVMLFRPYRPWTLSIGGHRIKVPFTPGLFPKEQKRLAEQVAKTITLELLTAEDLTRMAQRLVTPEQLERGVGQAFDLFTKEFRDIRRYHRFVDELATYLSDLLVKFSGQMLERMQTNPELLEDVFRQFFDKVILEIRLTSELSDILASSLMETVFQPDQIRVKLIRVMADQPIDRVNDRLLKNLTGLPYLITKVVPPKMLFERFRGYLVDQPEEANLLIEDLMTELQFKKQLAKTLRQANLKKLPYDTLDRIRNEAFTVVINGLVEHRSLLEEKIQSDAFRQVIIQQIKRVDLSQASESTITAIKREIAEFLFRVLETETEAIVRKLIPQLGIEQIIASKIELFSPRQLEQIILSIAKKELRGIEIVGGILGFVIGLFNTLTLAF